MIPSAAWQAVTTSYATYAQACDEKRYDLLGAVFAADATLAYHVAGHAFSCRGEEAARYFAGFLTRCYWTHHLIAHPAIEVVDGGLQATARVTATHLQRRNDGALNRWLVRGFYHDRFEYRDGRWLIVSRQCHCLDAEGDFVAEDVVEYPAPSWLSG